MAKTELPIISLFSGALGLDLGLEKAGFRVKVAVECNKFAAETIRLNRPDIEVIPKRIEDVSTDEILEAAKLKPGEAALVTGGPSCQAFSTAGQRGSMSDPRGVMFREFLRVVDEARPRFFVMENVRGILSAAIRHRPLGKRGPGYPALTRDERLGSALAQVLRELKKTGYYVVFDLLNAADFGVPSTRERVAFIGSRDGEPIWMPEPTHGPERTSTRRAWVTLEKAIGGLKGPHSYTPLAASKARFLRLVPTGGNWKDLPPQLQKKALGAAYVSWGGRSGFCRRLGWDRPAPALTTRPDSKATMLCHPTETRPLSIDEYKAIQQFPKRWRLAGGKPQQYKQLGNAVPVGFGAAIGGALRIAMRRRARLVLLGSVVCANPTLMSRLAARPQTVLNPPRMRRYKSDAAAKKWLGGAKRGGLKRLITTKDSRRTGT
ncbi:MAG: DNA cytosine methyltransferase [Labilithrix sp.]|nr:DNA cytosine methyltransferase [Labilithrix sp.]MCW5811531.1 DNA cytosine methyltransferase [Labilithrix sp.]